MNQILYIVLSLFVSLQVTVAQELAAPIDIPMYLSGNFGELRNNHFHAGIDFKTNGKIGFPIRSVMEGYVSRISVSPTGYGRAVYIDHPNGTTTVYGHLERFAPELENFVRDSQYIKQSFRVDLLLPKEKFSVKKGDLIAYSGNTGSSGGPHLHFEIRNKETEEVIDPLPAFMTEIEDNRKPEMQALMIYSYNNEGIVNGSTNKQEITIKKNKAGKQTMSASIQAWGKIGVAVKAYDRMDGTSNLYGVKSITLLVDEEEVFNMEMDRFAFSESRYLNSLVDWNEWVENKSFYMKSFIEPGNKLRIYKEKDQGIIHIDKERTYKLTYILKDMYGNTTTFPFEIEGKKEKIPSHKPWGTYYAYNKDNRITVDNIDLSIPNGNLYTDVYLSYSKKKNYTPYSSLYAIGKRMPLHSYCPFTISIENDHFKEKEKYGIIAVVNGRMSWIGGVYNNGKITTEIRELGSYSVTIDTVLPKITPFNPQLWAKNKKISFKISDNLSGISTWSATLNGEFVLFEYDAKSATLFCQYDAKRMKKGKLPLNLWIEDDCKNRNTYSKEITW